MDRLLTPQMVEDIAVTPASTLREWVQDGVFPASLRLPDGREVWLYSDVESWMRGLARVRPGSGQGCGQEATALAEDILQVLTESNGEWMTGREIAKAIGETADHTNGTFRRAIEALKSRSAIVSEKQGYALAGSVQGVAR